MNRYLLLLPAVLSLCPLLTAHDLYILPDRSIVSAKTTLGVAFHDGDTFPESGAAPSLNRLEAAQLHFREELHQFKN